MCSSARSTFAWIGAILMHVGFISLISFGAAKLWPLGFALSGIYTFLLFLLAAKLGNQTSDTVVPVNDVQSVVQQAEGNGPTRREYPILSNLTYALAVYSLGVTGSFLPFNLFRCDVQYSPASSAFKWTTDTSSLPQTVRIWIDNRDSSWEYGSSFAFVKDTGTTLFSGRSYSDQESSVWIVLPNTVPQPQKRFSNPEKFTVVSNDTVCFKTTNDIVVVCTDGITFRGVSEPHVNVHDLFAFNNSLWAKAYPSDNNDGVMIYTLDPSSTALVLLSQLQAATSDPDTHTCTLENSSRQMAFASLFTTALPVTFISVLLWWKKRIPSMGMTAYVGITLVYVTLFTSIHPVWRNPDPVLWWSTLSGAASLVALSMILILGQVGSLQWAINTTGLAFMLGMGGLLFSDVVVERFWRWVVVNVFCFLPLLLLGTATNIVFITFLGAAGLLIDAGRFAALVGAHVDKDFSFLVVSLVFALSGCLIGMLGVQLSKIQASVQEWTVAHLRFIYAPIQPVRENVLEYENSLLLTIMEKRDTYPPSSATT